MQKTSKLKDFTSKVKTPTSPRVRKVTPKIVTDVEPIIESPAPAPIIEPIKEVVSEPIPIVNDVVEQVDYFKEIATPTAEKNTTIEIEDTPINNDDFAREPLHVSNDYVESQHEPEAEPKRKTIDASTSASIYISLVDMTQKFGFSKVLMNKLKKRTEDIGSIDEIRADADLLGIGKTNEQDYTTEHLKALQLYQRIERKINTLPFSDSEKEMLLEPLSQIVAQAGYDLPPALALTFVFAQVMLPRIADTFFD